MISHPTIPFEPLEVVRKLVDSDRLNRYFDLLMEENSRVNLVSRETTRDGLVKLAAESLLPLQVLPASFSSYLDIGSGGGFPAIPLLLTGRVSGDTVLCERTRKKQAALARISAALGFNARTISQDFSELKWSSAFDLITLRYVRLEPRLLDQILSVLKPSGVFLYYSEPGFECSKCHPERHFFTDPADSVTKSFTLFRIS